MGDVYAGMAPEFSYPPVSPELEVLRSVVEGDVRTADEYTMVEGTLTRAARSAASRLAQDSARLYEDGTVRPRVFDIDDEAFADLRTHLEMTDGRAYAALIPIDPNPPVAKAAIGAATCLTVDEQREYEASGTLQLLREAVANLQGGVDPTEFNLDNLNSGMGSELGLSRSFVFGVREIGGRLYEYYALSDGSGGSCLDIPESSQWESLDSDSAEKDLERAVNGADASLYIVGPLDKQPVELLAPTGDLAGHESELLGLFMDNLTTSYGSDGVFGVPTQLSEEFDGVRYGGGAVASGIGGGDSEDPPVLLAMVGVYDEHPLIPVVWKQMEQRHPLRRAQVWLGMYLQFLLAALGVLFIASLIVSPVAFVYERRRTSEIELERERERVQREARKQVLDRLTELSHEVDAVAVRMAGTASREVADVSRDIDATIGALKDILGGTKERNGDSQ